MPSYAITGTSRGIGLGFVRALATDPANIVFAMARNPSSATELQEFAANHDNVHILKADNDDTASLKAAAEEVAKVTGGSLDVLINNAALMVGQRSTLPLDDFPSEDVIEEDLIQHFRTNVLGPIHTNNAFLSLLRAGKLKKCIVISSTAASARLAPVMPWFNFPGYAISKAAVNMVVAKFAGRLKADGIVCLAVAPGWVLTQDMTKEDIEQQTLAIRAVFPNHEGPVSTETSVKDMITLIHKSTMADSGKFINRDGADAEVYEIAA